MEDTPKLPLPDTFLEFLQTNGIDPSIYNSIDSTPRYIRLKPGSEAYTEEIEAEMKCKLERVNWLPGFYSLAPHIQIANSKAYKQGKIYGIDAASGAAVIALDISEGDHVLDLCAAPGAKLCMILDILGVSGSVTGVDVAKHRLAACRTMLHKYALGDACRLFVADGTTFSLMPVRDRLHSRSCEYALEEKKDTFREWTSRRPWKERKREAKAREHAASLLVSETDHPELIFYGPASGVVGLSKTELYRTVSSSEILSGGYDKVLVDAECTHDGSIKHIQKFENWGWETLNERVLNAERSDSLTTLQLKLLTNGFRLLRVGGSLVYSTCSLTVSQNEDVVEQFLKENSSAENILAGLVIAATTEASEVVISDGNPLVVDYIQHSVDSNSAIFGGTKVNALTLHWGEEVTSNISNTFDVIVASDCTFFEEFHNALACTVKLLLRNDGPAEAIFFSPKRGDSLEKFLEKIEENGLHFCITENYDPEVWKRHQGFMDGDNSWPSYNKDHCYPLLVRITLQTSKPFLFQS